MFFAVAAAALGLWAATLIPPYQNWGNPNEDGFSYVPLLDGVAVRVLPARRRHHRPRQAVARARVALLIGCGFLLIVVLQRFGDVPG